MFEYIRKCRTFGIHSMRLMTHIGKITSGYLPCLNRSRSTLSAMPQMNETILLLVVGPTVFFALVRFVKARRLVAAE
ncbi:MAG: hypothetical protein JWQ22_1426 [Devosia sp.]|nr:hypothetical protein [Devosia sp.]